MYFINFGKLATIIPSNIAFLPFFFYFLDANRTFIRQSHSIFHNYEPLFYIFHLSFFAAFWVMFWNFILIYSTTFSIFPPACPIASHL